MKVDNIRGSEVKGVHESLYYFYNFYVRLKLFKIKNHKKATVQKISKSGPTFKNVLNIVQ